MTLNHINLVIADMEAAIALFEKHFGFTCTGIKGDNVISILKNNENFVLVLMSPRLNQNGNSTYPDAFHIGFMQESTDAVTAIYEKLRSSGVVLEQEPKKIRDSFGFYFHFDNLMIEVGHYLS